MRACSTCRYFDEPSWANAHDFVTGLSDRPDRRGGYCRRNAPTIATEPKHPGFRFLAAWPVVLADGWCGEFVLRATPTTPDRAVANTFEAACETMLDKLHASPGRLLSHSVLMKRMNLNAEMFRALVDVLLRRGQIERVTIGNSRRNGVGYRVTRPTRVDSTPFGLMDSSREIGATVGW